ncbi:MAG: RluA family pseudouridine synthase [Pirellulaceae bacterium]|nr:RluA family pseudouridine synthase [Pirellulaceae bacterium]
MTLSEQPVELTVGEAEAGHRLDSFLASHFTDYSRVHLRRVISAGGVKVDGRGGKPAYRLKLGQSVAVALPEIPREAPRPENIPLDVIYEDKRLAVINKPPGMVVHPARGHWSGTLASALQFRYGTTLSAAGGISRPGIVHRLDRDTSGAILIARDDRTHALLSRQFADRLIEKEYFALVCGRPSRDRDLIDCPIGFHPRVREKMAIRRDHPESRPAQTFYEVLERFDGFAAVRALPKTGRTHQIRVHLNHAGFPVLCDRQYGGRRRITRGEIRRDPNDATVLLERQALHARRLRFTHPDTGEPIEVEAPLPSDIAAVLEELRAHRGKS